MQKRPAEKLTNRSIVAVANQKGGVGKTTTAVNLATAMAAIDKKVLIVDLDPQGNASTGLGIESKKRKNNSYTVLIGGSGLEESIHKSMVPGLDIVPSTVDLSGAELELIDTEERHLVLAKAIESLHSHYDYILIDCPPSLGILTLNAMCAAERVLVPLQSEFYALEGLTHLMRTIKRIKQQMNPALEMMGVVLTMVDLRNRLSKQVEEDVRGYLKELVYDTVIPRNVRISEAPSHGKPVLLYDLQSKGAQAYLRLAKEILKKERDRQQMLEEAAA